MKKTRIEATIPVSIFKEGDYFVAHTPVLDISTSAKTFAEVKRRFHEAVDIFFEELSKKGTLNDVLEELGWTKIKKQWVPPAEIAHQPEKICVTA